MSTNLMNPKLKIKNYIFLIKFRAFYLIYIFISRTYILLHVHLTSTRIILKKYLGILPIV
jgi:hypothetical protein